MCDNNKNISEYLSIRYEVTELIQTRNKALSAEKAKGDVEVKANTNQEKLDKLYNAITPLLNNLKKNPEKDYILWPNRVEKVDQFEDMLRKIYQS